jgi:hypothetical protein
MSMRSLCLMLAVMTLLMSAPGLVAQTPARPDLTGIWTRTGPAANQPFVTGAPPLQPWAKAIYDENRAGTPPGTDEGHDQVDPTTYCLPLGMPRIFSLNQPFEIVQTASEVYMLFESQQMQRRIYLDGRKLPENYPLTYMGFSTGRYDGDTLVVETAAISDLPWLDQSGAPHSDALRVTERIRRTSPTMLEIAFRFEDPKAFTRPVENTKTYQIRSDWSIMENIGYCEDRFRYNYGKKIFKGTVDWQSPEQAAGGR